MTDIFEGLEAPTDDELGEFDRLARETPYNVERLGTLSRLMIPRLVQEIRRLRKLDELTREREELRDERKARPEPGSFTEYTDGLERLRNARKGGA